jgi:AAA ATPase-like protein
MTEPEHRYRVEISGGKGTVVGDYATVFQIFENCAPTLASYIRTPQFRSLVDERTRDFIGRGFVFDRIDELLAGAEFGSGYVTVRGEPGIGKTSIAAALVARRGYVHHFNIAPENIRTARQFLENVCAQLIVRFRLGHTALPPNAGEDSGFLSQLLAEAADRAEGPVVVVVDALDEAEDTGLPASANRLLLPRVLPPGVFFVLTTREEDDYRLDVDHEATIWIREEDPGNREDVERYTTAFIDRHGDDMAPRLTAWGVSRAEFTAALAGLSEGNFMYLVHVMPEIAAGRLAPDTAGGISTLPRGLKNYYQRHWRDMKDADPGRFTTFQRPVLCFLAISREPVTLDQLAQWTLLEPADIAHVIRAWREFLNEDADAYRIYHRSFAEFLDDHENLRYYHDRIAEAALAKIPGFLSS